MNPHHIHTEQKNIVAISAALTNVSFKSDSEALQTIALRLLKNFCERKTTLVVVSDDEDRKQLTQKLSALSIDDLVLNISLQHTVTESDLQFLRNQCSQKSKKTLTQNTHEYKFLTLSEKIRQHFQKTYITPIFDDKSWTELLYFYLHLITENKLRSHSNPCSGLDLEYSKQEYDKLHEDISEALFLYQREFEINDHNEIPKSSLNPLINQTDDFHHISYTLFGLKEEAFILAEKYDRFISDLSHFYKKTSLQYLDDIQDTLNIMSFEYTQHSFQKNGDNSGFLKGLLSTSKKKEETSVISEINAIIDTLKEKNILTKNYPKVALYSQIPDTLNDITIHLSKRKQDINHITHEFVKSVNRLNYLDPTCENLEYQLIDLTKKINDSELFTVKHELNTLSLLKQKDYLEKLINTLDIAILNIEKNMAYYQWMSFLRSRDKKSSNLIKQLKTYDPSEWLDIFTSSYYGNILETHFSHLQITSDTIEKLEFHFVESEKSIIEKNKFDLYANVEVKIVNIKKDNPELYNALIKGKALKQPTLWKNFIAVNAEIISTISPIIIANSDDFVDLNAHTIDEIIYFDYPTYHTDILNIFRSALLFFKEDFFQQPVPFMLTGEKINSNLTLQEVHTTAKIALVRNITKELLQYDASPTIFRLRNTTIISFCSDYYNQRLNNHFYDKSIKKLFGDNIKDTITGALLDDQRYIYILTEDGLFNHDVEKWDIIQQKYSINYLDQVGCEVLDIDNQVILETKGESLQEIFLNIKMEDHPSAKFQNQMSLEFN